MKFRIYIPAIILAKTIIVIKDSKIENRNLIGALNDT